MAKSDISKNNPPQNNISQKEIHQITDQIKKLVGEVNEFKKTVKEGQKEKSKLLDILNTLSQIASVLVAIIAIYFGYRLNATTNEIENRSVLHDSLYNAQQIEFQRPYFQLKGMSDSTAFDAMPIVTWKNFSLMNAGQRPSKINRWLVVGLDSNNITSLTVDESPAERLPGESIIIKSAPQPISEYKSSIFFVNIINSSDVKTSKTYSDTLYNFNLTPEYSLRKNEINLIHTVLKNNQSLLDTASEGIYRRVGGIAWAKIRLVH